MTRLLALLLLLSAPALAQDDGPAQSDAPEEAFEAPPDEDQFGLPPEDAGAEGVDEDASIEELFGLPEGETEETFKSVVAGERVTLRGLNKITANSNDFTVEFGQPVRFGSLTIVARYCSARPPEFIPETFVFLEIFDRGLRAREADDYGEKIFSGWMLGSSPGLHGLEHPVFDVWPIACAIPSPPESPEPEEDAAWKSPCAPSASRSRFRKASLGISCAPNWRR